MYIVNVIQVPENELKKDYKLLKVKGCDFTEEEFIKTNSNRTFSVINQVKNIYKWNDIVEMSDFVQIIKKFKKEDSFVKIHSDEKSLLVKVFEKVAKSGEIAGSAVEIFIEVFDSIKDSSRFDPEMEGSPS